METSGEETEHTDVLELVKDAWAELGIELLIRPSQLEVFRRRVFSGEAMMSAYNGNFGFGLPTPDMSPDWLAPVSQQQLQWPKWGSYFESKGRDGEAPALPSARRLVELYQRWLVSGDADERARVWAEMLDINAEEVFTIGIVGGTLQPIVVKTRAPGDPGQGHLLLGAGLALRHLQPRHVLLGGRPPLDAARAPARHPVGQRPPVRSGSGPAGGARSSARAAARARS